MARRCGPPSFAVALLLDRIADLRYRLRPHSSTPSDPDYISSPVAGRRRADTYFRRWVLRERVYDPSVPWPSPRVRSGPDPNGLRPPMVLVALHTGPLGALSALWDRLPGEVAVLLESEAVPSRRAEPLVVSEDEAQRMAVTRRAARVLQRGGFVFMALDGKGTSRVEATLLGRTVFLSKGAFALARITRSPILPVAVRWQGSGIEIVAGDPIAPASEPEMAAAFTRWLEAYLRAHPGQLKPPLHRAFAELLGSEALAGDGSR